MTYRDAIAKARQICGARSEDTRTAPPRELCIRRTADERQIAYAEVYVPMRLDAHNEFMLPVDIEEIAHGFARKLWAGGQGRIDVMHDGKPGRAYPVETFVARDGDPDFEVGSWVLGLKVEDPQVWKGIKAAFHGEKGATVSFGGLSFQSWVTKKPVEVEVDEDGVTILDLAEAA